MKYDQHNFVVAITAKAEDMTSRMNEVFEIKLALSQHFINNEYKFAIVGEDIVSNDISVSSVVNMIVSVIPKASGTIKLIDEENDLKTAIADVVNKIGYRCLIAGEDMMSELAKDKIIFLPKGEIG